MESSNKKNYLIQSNLFTKSVLRDASEFQKDIIYYLQNEIDFNDPNPTGKVVFNYENFLRYKKIEIKKNTYSAKQILTLCEGLTRINGAFYNKLTASTVFFNLIDNVEASELNPNEFTVTFANFGKIFFYEKFALEYANTSKIQYTQIESNIIDLKGDNRKKLFELLSQYKKTGFYRVSLEELKTLLGFIEYEYKTDSDYQEETPQMQLKLLFENESIPENYKRVEYLQVWGEFKRVFLDPAIEAFNSNNKLDISNIHYEPIKTGRKITGLVFTFQKRLDEENLSREDKNALTYFQDYGLNKNQIMFLLQRIGSDLMFKRFNDAVTFNRYIDDTDSKHYRMKIWFDNKTQEPIKNLGGYLYEKVFPELKK